jgi:hypothetical protein
MGILTENEAVKYEAAKAQKVAFFTLYGRSVSLNRALTAYFLLHFFPWWNLRIL